MRTLSEYNMDALLTYFPKDINNGADVKCECGAEMEYVSPGTVLTSYPPKVGVKCPVCGKYDFKIV